MFTPDIDVRARPAPAGVSVPDQSDPHSELIHDADEIRELLEGFARQSAEWVVRTRQDLAHARLLPEHDADAASRAASIGNINGAAAMAEFFGTHAVYQVPIAEGATPASVGGLPQWVCKTVRRKHRRGAAPSGVTLSIELSGSGTVLGTYPMHDLSHGSLSILVSGVSRAYPGLEIPFACIRGELGEARVKLVVRSCRPHGDAATTVIGATFIALSASDARTAQRFVEAALYPTTRAATDEVWELHESSGYLELSGKSPADFEHLRAGYMEFVRKSAPHPDVAVTVCWPARERALATISNYKPFSSTWLGCQLSKRRDVPAQQGRMGLRDLYLRSYEAAQADPEARWLLTYVQDAAPSWSRKLHVDLPERYVKTGEGCLLPFRALELQVSPLNAAARASAVAVRAADSEQARRAVRALCRVRPAQYLDALDLTEERWSLSAVSARWRKAGLERERQLLIAWEGETASALAVLETAGPYAHVFGLLDSLRMYPLRPGGLRAFGSLLRAAHGWFAERGRRQFVYMREFADDMRSREHGFRDLGGATLTLLAVERIPELMQRVNDLVSPRALAHSVSAGIDVG